MEYFKNFPTISYNNTIATNIIARVRLKDELKKLLATYYDYTIPEGHRADKVAHDYYKDPFKSWLIFFANDITDPLLEWYKDTPTLENSIIAKYGSLDAALSRTAYYRVAWSSDETKLSTTDYEALSANQKRYWTRSFNSEQGDETYWRQEETSRDYSKFVKYQRARVDLYAETNAVLKISYTVASGVDPLEIGDIVEKWNGDQLTARGEICFIGVGYLFVKHVTEADTGFTTGTLVVRETDLELTITGREVKSTPIAADEYDYWEPVSFYTFEQELNDSRKLISLLSTEYAQQAEQELSELLR